MSQSIPLSLTHLPCSSSDPLLPEYSEQTLACVTFTQSDCIAAESTSTVVQVNTPMIGVNDQHVELWSAGGALSAGELNGVKYRFNHELLFGSIILSESAFTEAPAENGGEATPLQRATKLAFTSIFGLLEALDYPHLLRIWNYFPAINSESYELERYRQFNIGRQQAFSACGRSLTKDIPAACALGTMGGELVIYFIAVHEKPIAIENPRQVSAYHYPPEYGPSEPTFSRATLGFIGEQEVLFISGTASIVGHKSIHIGDVVAQTKETLLNIEAVIKEASQHSSQQSYTLEELVYKVYLRRQDDFKAVHQLLVEKVGPTVQVSYLEADICRQDLLVEIEAVAGVPLKSL